MSTVIKVGGALLERPAEAAATIRGALNEPSVVVHGGGIQITRMLEKMNVQSRFVDGLRVTDAATLHAVSLALLGEVHSSLVHALQSAGVPAVGVFGGIRAQKKDGPWGFVGTDLKADPELLRSLLAIGRVPVIPTLSADSETLLNVNGDETAAAVAVSIRARRLIFMTDVPGVKDAEGMVIGNVSDVDQLLDAKFVSGGMLPKLRAVKSALRGGVSRVTVGQTEFASLS
jgi:acetylglutamate kinase